MPSAVAARTWHPGFLRKGGELGQPCPRCPGTQSQGPKEARATRTSGPSSMGSWTSAPRPGAADAGPGRGEGSSTFPPSAEAVGGTQVAEEKVEANFIVLGPGFCDYLHGLPASQVLLSSPWLCVSKQRDTIPELHRPQQLP